ncbi:hypothetical protein COT75_02075 [Candidatus Beckwithbacteria bacterium CG10_big_fil_rev_8_21_14_0_10_34_10]|uniref:Sigma-54 factor interaction domain-containing protein n=1 Tax=Candidatus Beckwithbacteria bacterium CG10_big_fil_rev_8_21_14_0_10_34_10 TaxID=1974495 RepID=A0A2H0W9P2_9BACT|nr:MAG: hypothetical protein COT75_02075 [Candidatus Beckwithbacteria bacterium CG10_big_fil_rev_8_21_14_0_10_34_10]
MILAFLSWHYIKGCKEVLRAWFNLISFGLHLFSVKLLFKTLFSPWRRIAIVKNTPGFSLKEFFYRLSFNLISIVIGFVIRILLIIWGILFSLFFFILFLPLVLLWPFLSPLTLFIYLFTKKRSYSQEDLIKKYGKKFIFPRLGIATKEELLKIPEDDLKKVIKWCFGLQEIKRTKLQFWRKENLFKISSFGTNLAFGYTPSLDKYSQDLFFPSSFSHHLVGREKEISQLEAVLVRKAQNNCFLVGEPGVGKKTIILGLAKAIKEQRIDSHLFYKRVLLLDMNLILGRAVFSMEAKARFSLILKEAEKAGNIILVIPQIDKYLSSQEGIDLTSVIAQMAESTKIQLIGITTPRAYEEKIFPNERILKYFERVEVFPPSKEEALNILEKILPDFERGRKTMMTYEALKEIIDQSDRFMSHIPFPEKAIDLLDQVIAESVHLKKKVVRKSDVDQLISQKTKVPVGALVEKEIERLKNLEHNFHQRLVNQNQAVQALVKAMKRTRTGVSEEQKPVGSFLFLGPTGVGKTETAKTLAQTFFGDIKKMVRFDMSQPLKLELFFKECRENPYTVLLLDEFEKADSQTLNLFLPVFDEGYIKDNYGRKISFKNMIIVCTSNAGAEFIREKVKQGITEKEIVEYILKKNIFSPELLNRFDSVVVFKPLQKDHVVKIVKLQLNKLSQRLLKKDIYLYFDPIVYPLLAQEGYSLEFGARPLKRLLADKIESLIADDILKGKIKKHDKIKLTVDSLTKEYKIGGYG